MKLVWTLLVATLSFSSIAGAAPVCLDLTKGQAERAVRLIKVALHNQTPLIIYSKKESGMSYAHGAWMERKKGLRGPKSYRVRIDGREVDISLLYVSRSRNHSEAWNLAWMSGCRPALDKPASIRL